MKIVIRSLIVVFLIVLGFALSGCARFRSVQIQVRTDGTRVESRQTISTFWDSQSSIAKLRASTTDKTQGLTVGGFAESSEASNVVSVLSAVTEAAVQGAIKGAKTP